jgi:3-dehydroquinate dehydratase-1
MISIGSSKLDGTPRVVLAVRPGTDREAIAACMAQGVDVVELRVDHGADCGAEAVLAEVARLTPWPVLATIRWAPESGGWRGTEAERLALYRALLPAVDAVDVELEAREIRDGVIAAAHGLGKPVLGSFHDFSGTPNLARLEGLARDADECGADILKIAVTCGTRADLQRLASFTLAHRHRPLVTIAMGPEGLASRVFFPALGSLLTYTFLGAPTAPGQLTCGDTLHYLRVFYPERAGAGGDVG